MRHTPWFGHNNPAARGPICRACGAEITAESWASDEPCPMRCQPPAVHMFLNGAMACECEFFRHDAELADFWMGLPAVECRA